MRRRKLRVMGWTNKHVLTLTRAQLGIQRCELPKDVVLVGDRRVRARFDHCQLLPGRRRRHCAPQVFQCLPDEMRQVVEAELARARIVELLEGCDPVREVKRGAKDASGGGIRPSLHRRGELLCSDVSGEIRLGAREGRTRLVRLPRFARAAEELMICKGSLGLLNGLGQLLTARLK